MSISNALQDGTLGTWVWYGRHRFSHWSGWLRPWNWVKFKRPKRGTYLWRLTVGPFELRRVRGLLGHLPRRQRRSHLLADAIRSEPYRPADKATPDTQDGGS